MKPFFALVDCNSFFVSCEKVFQPHLEGRPIVVLSSNDGCVIARSQEAKDIGIPMGIPLFKIQSLVERYNVKVISSNFSLYGDMSSRVMAVLKRVSPSLEIYSIDEAFLHLNPLPLDDLFSYGCYLKSIVKTWTGIPISVGIGSTKTLAKVANHLAKNHPSGCYVLIDPKDSERALRNLSTQDVWGIGSQGSKKLSFYGITTAWDLAQKDHRWIRKTFNVTLARTALELQGIPCLSLEEITSSKKSLISSRSFGKPVTSIEVLREALSFHASSLALKLRQQKNLTSYLRVFIRTNPFDKNASYDMNSSLVPLFFPSNDTTLLIKAALSALEDIFKEGLAYKKAGVMAFHLTLEETTPFSLFQNEKDADKRRSLFKTMDQLNNRWGRGSLIFASEGFHKTWHPKASLKSPSFTQDWNHLPRVR